jgi:hypothetical protein
MAHLKLRTSRLGAEFVEPGGLILKSSEWSSVSSFAIVLIPESGLNKRI